MRQSRIVPSLVLLLLVGSGPRVARAQGGAVAERQAAVQSAINDFWSANDVELTPGAKSLLVGALDAGLPRGISIEGISIITRVYLHDVLSRQLGAVESLSERELAALPPQGFLEANVGKGRVGYLRVTSMPLGGVIEVDGQPRGTTPGELVLPVGQHAVAVSLAGERCEETVRIKKDEVSSSHCRGVRR